MKRGVFTTLRVSQTPPVVSNEEKTIANAMEPRGLLAHIQGQQACGCGGRPTDVEIAAAMEPKGLLDHIRASQRKGDRR